jgi:hypothetical protein
LVFEIAWVALAVVPFWFQFSRTDMIIWYFGLYLAWKLERVWRHIRTIQHRLAWMHDDMDRQTRRNDNSGYDNRMLECM